MVELVARVDVQETEFELVRKRIASQDEELVGLQLGLWTVLRGRSSTLLSMGTVETLYRCGTRPLVACADRLRV